MDDETFKREVDHMSHTIMRFLGFSDKVKQFWIN